MYHITCERFFHILFDCMTVLYAIPMINRVNNLYICMGHINRYQSYRSFLSYPVKIGVTVQLVIC